MEDPVTDNFFSEEVEQLRSLLPEFKGQVAIVCLEGDLGAGKTTFVQRFLHSEFAQSSEDIAGVQSPTFLKLLEYDLPSLGLVLHIDAYRMEDEDELVKLCLESYEDPGLVFVEWPELFLSYLLQSPTLQRLWGVKEYISIKIQEGKSASERVVQINRVQL